MYFILDCSYLNYEDKGLKEYVTSVSWRYQDTKPVTVTKQRPPDESRDSPLFRVTWIRQFWHFGGPGFVTSIGVTIMN